MNNYNKKYVGIWVDHKQAYIVFIENNQSTMKKICSHIGKHHRSGGGSRSKNFTGEIVSEQKYDNKYKHNLNIYYDEIIAHLDNPDSLVIFGPGAGKRELLKRIEKSLLNKVEIAGIVTLDKMTEQQITSYTRDFFNV